jgi:hypothetical protein
MMMNFGGSDSHCAPDVCDLNPDAVEINRPGQF